MATGGEGGVQSKGRVTIMLDLSRRSSGTCAIHEWDQAIKAKGLQEEVGRINNGYTFTGAIK